MQIDLNADVGESFGAYRYGDDEGVMPSVSSANIACGFHAGDPAVMRSTVLLATRHDVGVGAHPGFQDLLGFGRREMQVGTAELESLVAYQIGALAAIAAAEGTRLGHVKPHGALYNMAARDRAMADSIARAVRAVDASLVLFGLSGSQLIASGERAGLRVASEVFADRGYLPDGSLAPRGTPGAVLAGAAEVAKRAVEMASGRTVTALDGSGVSVRADTICIHGDTPGAAALARAVRDALTAAGIDIVSPGRAR
ncbi:MAG TPA: 5-oxoprolinase subunit PxpA [Vicinamibacterales bacterium]|nr:5-oxoprolinase subunit PxpA [Vicinamibacterales bacterium]